MSSTATTTNTMPVGTISLTTQQLMEMLANARAEGRAEALKELGVASSTGGVAPAVPSAAAPAPMVAQDAATQPPPKKKRKRITLPDGTDVKNPTSAYIFYCKKHRAETKEANPELKSTELTAALGAQWSALTDEGKAPYNTLAAADKERYAAQVAQAAEAASGASMGVSMGATDTTAAAPAPGAAPPTAPPVLPGAAAPSPDIIEPVPLPPSLMPSPAATAVFKTGTPGASSSA